MLRLVDTIIPKLDFEFWGRLSYDFLVSFRMLLLP